VEETDDNVEVIIDKVDIGLEVVDVAAVDAVSLVTSEDVDCDTEAVDIGSLAVSVEARGYCVVACNVLGKI